MSILPIVYFAVAGAKNSASVSHIRSWDFLGPFPIGKGELDGDPLAPYGGIWKIPRQDKTQYYSELATSGKISWTKLPVHAGGAVQIQPAGIDWNRLNNINFLFTTTFHKYCTLKQTHVIGWYKPQVPWKLWNTRAGH
jgi:hypothetical protein